jgi:hypothetical protein
MSLFEKLTDGLRLYEVILLMMGVIMFLALVVILIVYASQRRTLKPLLIFFLIPLLMLVWPSIAKIKIDGEGADIQTKLAAVEKNPTPQNKKELQDAVDKIEDRNVKDPAVLRKIAMAHYLLGDTTAAKTTIHKLPGDVTTKDTTITKIIRSIDLNSKLQKQINDVNNNPTDSNKVKELNATRIEAAAKAVKSEEMVRTINTATQKVEVYKETNPKVKIDTRSRLRPQ